MIEAHATELTLVLQRRPGTEHARGGTSFAEYDIVWPDGSPVDVGLRRFCNSGARLILGRRYDGQTALVRLTIHPVAGLQAPLSRGVSGVRWRRFYALRRGDSIRLHFLDGTPTETVFHLADVEPRVLRWLQAERMQPDEPFWFDLSSQTLTLNGSPVVPNSSSRERAAH